MIDYIAGADEAANAAYKSKIAKEYNQAVGELMKNVAGLALSLMPGSGGSGNGGPGTGTSTKIVNVSPLANRPDFKYAMKQSLLAQKNSEIRAYNPTPARAFFERMSKGTVVEKFVYNLIDPFIVYGTSLYGPANHLNGNGANNREITEAGVGVWSNLIQTTRIEVSIVGEARTVVNAAQYNSLFKGLGTNSRITNAVKMYNYSIKSLPALLRDVSISTTALGYFTNSYQTLKNK